MMRFWAMPFLLGLGLSPVQASNIDAASRHVVLEKAADLIRDRYVDPSKAKKIEQSMRRDARDDRFSGVVDCTAFADAMTARLRAVSGDGHFAVDCRPADPSASAQGESDAAEFEKWYGVGVNHGFEKVERLESGIGYLELTAFAPLAMGGDLAAGAMSLLAQSPALIIDLRNNGGGMDDMAQFLSAYLLEGSHEVSGTYDRPSGKLTRIFTPSWVPGRKFGATKPVFILVSKRTFSAAEAFTYDLKALKRVTVVGERTGGGAHPFEFRRIDGQFVLSLPEGRSINPVTGTDWEGVGVSPDVPVPAGEALETALKLARAATAK